MLATPSRTVVPHRALGRLLRALAAIVLAVAFTAGSATTAQAVDPPGNTGGFDPGFIFRDKVMFDGHAMGAEQADARIREIGAACDSTRTAVPCLKDQRIDTPARAASKYCTAIPARTGASVGRLVTDVGAACSVSPKVIITMLQKEQGLVTTTEPTEKKMAQALGFRCPDYQTCDPTYAGLANQVYFAASRLQQYGDPAEDFTYKVGRNLVDFSPVANCGTAIVKIRSRATAALYNYTPFTPNQASLDAGAGVVPGDACASYGNRNVYRIYALWFGSPNGAPTSNPPVAARRL